MGIDRSIASTPGEGSADQPSTLGLMGTHSDNPAFIERSMLPYCRCKLLGTCASQRAERLWGASSGCHSRFVTETEACLRFSWTNRLLHYAAGDSVWTGRFYVLREDGCLASYPSKDIERHTPVKVSTPGTRRSPQDTLVGRRRSGKYLMLTLSAK